MFQFCLWYRIESRYTMYATPVTAPTRISGPIVRRAPRLAWRKRLSVKAIRIGIARMISIVQPRFQASIENHGGLPT